MKRVFIWFIMLSVFISLLCSCNTTTEQGETSESSTKSEMDENTNETQSAEEDEEQSVTENSSLENYIGTWYDDFLPPDELVIHTISDGIMKCDLGIYRITTFYLIATVGDQEVVFHDEQNLISGHIEFQEAGIRVVIDESDYSYIVSGIEYFFSTKK